MKNKTKENTKFVMWKSFRYERTYFPCYCNNVLDVRFHKIMIDITLTTNNMNSTQHKNERYKFVHTPQDNKLSTCVYGWTSLRNYHFVDSLFRHLNDILMNGNNYFITWPAAFSLNHST